MRRVNWPAWAALLALLLLALVALTGCGTGPANRNFPGRCP